MEYEGNRLLPLHLGNGVADELVGIGGYESGGIFADVEIYAVHRRTYLVVGGGIYRGGNAFYQALGREVNAYSALVGTFGLREVVSREIRQGGLSAGPSALEGACVLHAEGERLVRQFLEEFDKVLCRYGYAAVLL